MPRCAWIRSSRCSRPPASRANSIGIWEGVLEFVSFFSVITNGLVIAVTSTFITKAVYSTNYGPGLSGYVNITHPYFPEAGCRYVTPQGTCEFSCIRYFFWGVFF